MVRSFLKSLVFKRAIYADSWIMLLSSFVLSFVMAFSFSMAYSLIRINRLFLYQDMIVESDLDSEQKEYLDRLADEGRVGECNLVGNLYGVLETKADFGFARLKEVDSDYFSKEKLSLLHLAQAPRDKQGFVISSILADRLHVAEGDRLAFVDSSSGRAIVYEVISVFETGLSAFDEKSAFLVRSKELRNGLGQDRIYSGSRSYEVVFPNSVSIRMFGRSAYDGYDPALIRDIYSSPISDKAAMPRQSQAQIINSVDSIRFVLLLFVALSVCYVFAFIRNFQRRSESVVRTYRLLGCGRIGLLEGISLLCISSASMLTGMISGMLFCWLLKSVLSMLGDWGIVSLDYYVLKFPIRIPFGDLMICFSLVIGALALARFIDFCIKKLKGVS